MTSFLSSLDGLDRRITATAALPTSEQPEALVALFQSIPRDAVAPFVALLIGEVVARRPQCPPVTPAPHPLPAAASVS